VSGTTNPNFYYDQATNTLYTPNISLSGITKENTTLFNGLGGDTVVVQLTSADYDGAYFDYFVKDGTNKRIGTVMAVWEGANVEYTDYSTADLGDTLPISFTVDISAPNAQLNAIITSGSWTVQTGVRVI